VAEGAARGDDAITLSDSNHDQSHGDQDTAYAPSPAPTEVVADVGRDPALDSKIFPHLAGYLDELGQVRLAHGNRSRRGRGRAKVNEGRMYD